MKQQATAVEQHPEKVVMSDWAKLSMWVVMNCKEPRENSKINWDGLNEAARFAIRELEEFVSGLPEFSPHDYRSVDASLLRWAVAYGEKHPFTALFDVELTGHPDSEPVKVLIHQREDIDGAYARLSDGDVSPYSFHRSPNDSDWYAGGINYGWFPEY